MHTTENRIIINAGAAVAHKVFFPQAWVEFLGEQPDSVTERVE